MDSTALGVVLLLLCCCCCYCSSSMGAGGYYVYLQNLAACFGSTETISCSPLPFSGPGTLPAMFGLPAMIVTQCDANDDNETWADEEFPVVNAIGFQMNTTRSNICTSARKAAAGTADAE